MNARVETVEDSAIAVLIAVLTFMNLGYHLYMNAPDPILAKFKAALTALYGDRIERVVLFGSRARGDVQSDSDYDVALFLKNLTDTWQEVRRIVDIEHAIRDVTDADIHTMPFPAGSWRDASSPLMFEIRRDGLDL